MLQEKFVRLQLGILKPFTANCSLETTREGQNKLGQLMATVYRNHAKAVDSRLGDMPCAMVTPKDELTGGIALYLHGGGYTCGDIHYAKGFATTLAAKCGIKVFCAAYRLAPEAPFPAALDDALIAYKHLLSLGYAPSDIVLCGESAGGGLIFALCLKLKELGYEMPAGLIGISPWTDLTLSGGSMETNRDADISLTAERLEYYANCYVHGTTQVPGTTQEDTARKAEPYISPLFGALAELPPSLLFVGGDEILLDDTLRLHEALCKAGCTSQLIVRKGMWHAYVLYCLKDNECDFESITQFLKQNLCKQKKLRWMRLDNAAKIYPAIKRRQWNNFFRLSVTLDEPIDRAVLQSALDITVRRFPSIAVRLRRGAFWYYLEEIPKAPLVLAEKPYPLVRTPFDDVRKCAFRVIAYENRIAAEFYHAITDGNGGLVFLKTLAAEYLQQKHGISIPSGGDILDRLEQPKEEELEDSFQKNSGKIEASRKESNAYHFRGTQEYDGYCTNTTFLLNAPLISAEAKKRGVSVTVFLTAALMSATLKDQAASIRNPYRRRNVKVLIPVNLRKIFPSCTLRNFVLYAIPEVEARLGEYSFDELCRIVHHQLGLTVTEKEMRKRIAVNVNVERLTILKLAPLFLKNLVMRTVFNLVGERKSCFSFSNLGIMKLPEPMRGHVRRMDFVLGVQARAPYNIGSLTCGDTLYVNFIRNIKEPLLERCFYQVLHELGLPVKVESNQRDNERRA